MPEKPGDRALAGKPLSARELDVLRLIAEGLTAQQIGKELYIATGTVRSHIRRLQSKLNASNLPHAVTISYRTFVLPLFPEDTKRVP